MQNERQLDDCQHDNGEQGTYEDKVDDGGTVVA